MVPDFLALFFFFGESFGTRNLICFPCDVSLTEIFFPPMIAEMTWSSLSILLPLAMTLGFFHFDWWSFCSSSLSSLKIGVAGFAAESTLKAWVGVEGLTLAVVSCVGRNLDLLLSS